MDDRVEPSEKAFIREYRQKHGISDDVHKCVYILRVFVLVFGFFG